MSTQYVILIARPTNLLIHYHSRMIFSHRCHTLQVTSNIRIGNQNLIAARTILANSNQRLSTVPTWLWCCLPLVYPLDVRIQCGCLNKTFPTQIASVQSFSRVDSFVLDHIIFLRECTATIAASWKKRKFVLFGY